MSLHENQHGASALVIDLTGTEKSCLTLVAEGLRHQDIGVAVNLTEAEVEEALLRAEMKLKASNRLHAVSLALTKGIIDGSIER
jgi:DNA-binding CsgD family transcriptional regulator